MIQKADLLACLVVHYAQAMSISAASRVYSLQRLSCILAAILFQVQGRGIGPSTATPPSLRITAETLLRSLAYPRNCSSKPRWFSPRAFDRGPSEFAH